MSAQSSRKELIRNYKERKPHRGAFAVRCKTSGMVWVGVSPTLDTAQNRIWFALRLGSHHEKPLQAEWNEQGEASFEYEILEELDEDANPLALNDLLKAQKAHWAERLNAKTLLQHTGPVILCGHAQYHGFCG